MNIFFLTLLFLVLMVSAMAIGVIVSNKPIKGSCGGIQSLGLGGDCEICGGDRDRCDKESVTGSAEESSNYYRAE